MSTPSTRSTSEPVSRRRRRALTTGLLLAVSLTGVTLRPGGSASASAGVGLPRGWELCILQGVGGHATDASLADLDTWQAAEGGGTQNGVAYNPFNTRRGTDQTGAAVPASYTATGFPVFANWPAGCAATVATILQPDMAPIATALGTAVPSSPTSFLSTVDTTPWCAPSAGVPCYVALISSHEAVTSGQAMTVLHDAGDALAAYDQDVTRQSALQGQLAGDQEQLQTADVELTLARLAVQHATTVLRSLAIYDYTSNPSLDHMAAFLGRFHPPSQTDMLQQYYLGLDAGAEVGQFQRAQAVLSQAQSARGAAAAAVDHTGAALSAATAGTSRARAAVTSRLRTLLEAGACGAPTSGTPPSSPDPVGTLKGCLSTLLA